MSSTNRLIQRGVWRFVLLIVAGSMVIAACSSSSDQAEFSFDQTAPASAENSSGQGSPSPASGRDESPLSYSGVESLGFDGAVLQVPTGAGTLDVKVIRDGRIDIRIAEGTFDARGAELRAIAGELGGYLSSGESHIEEHEENRYAVGWFTLRIPSERFETAVSRVEGLGERVSSSISSQDVSEEFVDLEGRLNYWTQQEAFYTKLLNEAETIQDLVTVQTQMQDVLLNIEQIEGRLRYLEARTSFATLTVGLTEVPDLLEPRPEPEDEPGTIEEAFDQAGEVLLATVGFLIVAIAVVIPIGILAGIAWVIVRLFMPKRKDESADS